MRNLLTVTVLAGLLALPLVAGARGANPGFDATSGLAAEPPAAQLLATQGSCKTLAQAIDSIRRSGNVERIISAETSTSGGRKVHNIKVLTKDGKVRTHRIPGC